MEESNWRGETPLPFKGIVMALKEESTCKKEDEKNFLNLNKKI